MAARKLLVLVLLSVLLPVRTARSAEDEVKVRMDDRVKQATAKAVKWLAGKQGADGSWSTDRFPQNTAITAFALLALMSQGNLPGEGEYGPEVEKGKNFLLSSAREDGYLIGRHGGNMYCHGMATLALAELWGTAGDRDVRPALKKAVDLIVRCQNPQGGWRYDPNPHDADISVTIMQVMALRAAKNSGIAVPDKTLERAISYIKSLYHRPSGGFGYQRPGDGPGFARSAAGVCVLQFSGDYDAQEIPKAVEYFKSAWREPGQKRTIEIQVGSQQQVIRLEVPNVGQHFWYGHYYAAHAMHQVGDKEWEEWYARISKLLLDKQSAAGYWNWADAEHVGEVYQTSIAVMILSIPSGYVPVFAR